MARWCDAMKLTDYASFRAELEGYSGVYEIGRVRSGIFYAEYVGKAKCLWDRISSYNGSRCHNPHIAERNLLAERKSLYFHYFKTLDYAATESRLMHRHQIGETGLYRFNRKYEYAHLYE
jgi:excinuclease UvrABC nuclease subunit